ncbi:MAG TPA: hypothetical protein VFH27_13805, partial [Longimicrobiaceae bacterium]|nr:hypothetical protein [Longimicrobiaceae bacterium]
VDPEPAPAPGGGLLVGTSACWDGPVGCRQQFALRRGGRWLAVSQPWVRSLPSWMPPRFNKGTYVDGRTLQASAGLYSPRDRNCCPSHELSAQLALRGTRLVLRRYRVIRSVEQ